MESKTVGFNKFANGYNETVAKKLACLKNTEIHLVSITMFF